MWKYLVVVSLLLLAACQLPPIATPVSFQLPAEKMEAFNKAFFQAASESIDALTVE